MPARYYVTGRSAGDEISSTYEGRHLSLEESLLVHPVHDPDLVAKGDPVLCGENIVGVAFNSAAANTDIIAIDTEGIWCLYVVADDDDGAIAVTAGDEIYINKTNGILSKISNKASHQRFGYALGDLAEGVDGLVAIKVHWNPDDAMELVGTSAAPFTSAKNNFREYRYRSTATSGDVRGIYMALGLAGIGESGEAMRARTIVEAVGVSGGVHGLHGGVEFGAEGTITGLAAGVRGTVMGPNRGLMATIAGGMSELFAEGAATDYGTATEHSIHRFVNDGDATGKATADNVWSFVGLSATQLQAHNAWVAGLTQVLRVIVDGAVRYVGLSDAP